MKKNVHKTDSALQILLKPERNQEIVERKKNKIELFFLDIGNATAFVLKVFKNTFGKDFEFKQFLKQCFEIVHSFRCKIYFHSHN